MKFEKVSFEESLKKDVIDTDQCVGCRTCIVVCPFHCLEYRDSQPRLIKECKICGICPQACPQYQWSQSKAENLVFGKTRKTEETFGIWRKMVVARANDQKILENCQDGGFVTAFLLFSLKQGIIDGVIAAGVNPEKPFHPIPKLASTPEEILESAGTKYSYSPNILALAEGIKRKKANMAFVGTPCQIRAIRKMQMVGLKKYTSPLRFLVGLMCSECFTYEGLMEKHINGTLNLNPNRIKKMNIKGKMLVTTDTETKTILLATVKKYVRRNCLVCTDFSSEFADISAGGLGLEGQTFVVLRSSMGEALFEKAVNAKIFTTRPPNKDEFALKLLANLTRKKRKSKSK